MTPATKRLIEQLSTIKRDKEQVHVKRVRRNKTRGHAHTEETKRKIAETLMKRKSNHVLVQKIEEMLSQGMSKYLKKALRESMREMTRQSSTLVAAMDVCDR